jgi:2-aminomuconate deaminase
MEWHEFGDIDYRFTIDNEFAPYYAEQVKALGMHTALVDYHGFPIDTGTIVAQKLLNPDNRLPAAMVSCNMYSDKNEMLKIGQAGARALKAAGKRAVAVLVSNLSNRFFTRTIDPREDRISSAKDHEWNLKLCELFAEGRMEDVSQCARDVAREANGDMGFRGIWWLNGLLGQSNDFRGEVIDYQPVYGTGAALIHLTPTRPVEPLEHIELEAESEVIHEATELDPKLRPATVGENERPGLAHPAAQQAAAAEWPKAAAAVKPPAETPAAPATEKRGEQVRSQRAPEPVGAYPHARREGEFLFLSGVGPRKPGTKQIPGVTLDSKGKVAEYDIEIQTRSVIENVRLILEDAGGSLNDVIDIQVFLTDMQRDFAAFNQIYAETFAAIGPTRTTVEVGALPTPIAVEFKVVAKLKG